MATGVHAMIPKKFQLLGYTWTVTHHDGPLSDPDKPDDKICGLCDFENHEIHLSGDLTPELLWHTFLHEMLHATLEAIGQPKLAKNEGLVDGLSGALAQALRPGIKTVRVRPRAVAKARQKPLR